EVADRAMAEVERQRGAPAEVELGVGERRRHRGEQRARLGGERLGVRDGERHGATISPTPAARARVPWRSRARARRRATRPRSRGCDARARARRAGARARRARRGPRGAPASAARRRRPPRAGGRRGTADAQAPGRWPRRAARNAATRPAAATALRARRARAPSTLPLARQRMDGGAPLLILLHVGLEDARVELERVLELELQLAPAVAQLGDAALHVLRLLDGGLHEAIGGDLRLLDQELRLAL